MCQHEVPFQLKCMDRCTSMSSRGVVYLSWFQDCPYALCVREKVRMQTEYVIGCHYVHIRVKCEDQVH